MYVYEWIWLFCLLILTGYHMVVFKRKPITRPRTFAQWPGVSIIIAHKDESEHVKQNLESLLQQNYPLFEIIIVDDHSSTVEKNNLTQIVDASDGLRMLSSDLQGKKHALIYGIESAQHELILCTDADCKPRSEDWIRKMVESGKRNEIILGYSPYKKQNGWMNLFIRFETAMTAIQYMSWAIAGRPYMGVGRNLMFPKKLFLEKKPYESKENIPFGDDDLWVQKLTDYVPARICDDPSSFVETVGHTNVHDWLNQKHRHLSAGHYYTTGHLAKPGIYGIALFFHWALILVLIICSFWWRWVPVFIIGIAIRWISYGGWTKRLGDRDTNFWYPVLEFLYAMYLGFMGIYTWIRKKKTWN